MTFDALVTVIQTTGRLRWLTQRPDDHRFLGRLDVAVTTVTYYHAVATGLPTNPSALYPLTDILVALPLPWHYNQPLHIRILHYWVTAPMHTVLGVHPTYLVPVYACTTTTTLPPTFLTFHYRLSSHHYQVPTHYPSVAVWVGGRMGG